MENQTPVGQIQMSSIVPNKGNVNYHAQKSNQIIKVQFIIKNTTFKPIAEALVNHYEIVEESRNLIRNSKSITWDQFINNNGNKKRNR